VPTSFIDYGSARLAEVVRPDMLCVFDFDGTLAPIARTPHEVRIPDDILGKLRRLAQLTRVAVITGRAVADIRDRLEFDPWAVVGNHGIEGVPGIDFPAGQYRRDCLGWENQTMVMLKEDGLSGVGVWIENKIYSLSVHYRGVVGIPDVEARLEHLLARLTPAARLIGGKCVINVMPADAPNKGEALDVLCRVSNATGALYVGDDVTDEDVFEMARESWLTIRIEDSIASAAEFYLPHRVAVGYLLDQLISKLSE
jgi:trehalose 6-phosphate phosphatase